MFSSCTPPVQRLKRRGWFRVDVFKLYHFAGTLRCSQWWYCFGLARPLGRPKSNARRALCWLHYFVYPYLRNHHLFCRSLAFKLFVFPAHTPQKNKGQNFRPHPKILPKIKNCFRQRYVELSYAETEDQFHKVILCSLRSSETPVLN